jgi:hypothetical protein
MKEIKSSLKTEEASASLREEIEEELKKKDPKNWEEVLRANTHTAG